MIKTQRISDCGVRSPLNKVSGNNYPEWAERLEEPEPREDSYQQHLLVMTGICARELTVAVLACKRPAQGPSS